MKHWIVDGRDITLIKNDRVLYITKNSVGVELTEACDVYFSAKYSNSDAIEMLEEGYIIHKRR